MRRYLTIIPSILLVIVASLQLYFVETKELSRWKGGGFGMYSDYRYGDRRISVEFIEEERKIFSFISQPDEFFPQDRQFMSLPSEENFERLAREIQQLNWVFTNLSREGITTITSLENIPEELILRPTKLKISLAHPTFLASDQSVKYTIITSFDKPWN